MINLIRNTLLLLVAIIIIGACRGSLYPNTTPSKDLLDVQRIVEVELLIRGVSIKKIPILFNEQPLIFYKNVVGLAIMTSNPYIRIKKSYFETAPWDVREALILHELAHQYGLNHDDSFSFVTGCPISVMHSTDSMKLCFSLLRDYYYTEVVDKINKIGRIQ